MGCNETRSAGLSEEEKVITKNEGILKFNGKPSKEMLLQLKRYSVNGAMSALQLRQAIDTMEASSEGLEELDSVLCKFYQLFKDHGKYGSRKLCIAAILLGTGTVQEKAMLLFEEWDIDINQKLSQEEVSQVLSDLYDVAVNYLPQLSIGVNPGQVGQDIIDTYISRIETAKAKSIENLTRKLLEEGTEVDKGSFICRIALAATNFLTSSGLRTYFIVVGSSQLSAT